jgi:hypothetical protein
MLSAAAVLAGSSLAAHAAVQTVSTQVSGQSVQGTVDPGNLLGQTQVSLFRQTLGYKAEGVGQGFTLSSALTTTQPDYSNYLVIQKNGAQIPLSQLLAGGSSGSGSSGTELSAAASMAWDSGPRSASLSWLGNVNSSPFAVQALTASYTEGFYEKTTLLGARASAYTARQPDSFYIDTAFVTRERPQLIHGNELAVFVDQVLTERCKVGAELSTADREEDRPRNVGGVLRGAYAFTDRVFGQLALTRIDELRSQPLLDERGYFTLSAAELSLTYEPWVDVLISPSYGWVLEDENDPRTGSEVRVGSDQYGLGLRYRRGAWDFELKSAYRATNTDLTDVMLGGGVTWRI